MEEAERVPLSGKVNCRLESALVMVVDIKVFFYTFNICNNIEMM